jgi:hypothetical protein
VNPRHNPSQSVLLLAATAALIAAARASAMDLRFDVATEATGNSDANVSYFTTAHLPALNFPSVNGHNVMQSNNLRNSTITAAGNTLGMYYNDYNTLFPGSTAAQAVTTINTYLTNSSHFGSAAPTRWLNLNEIDAGKWNDPTTGDAYRVWLNDTLTGLHNLGYNNIILWSPRYLASKTYASSFQAIAQNAYIGLESYLDGYRIKNSYNYNLAQVQAYYQGYFDAWTSTTNGPGLPASKIFAGEHFGIYPNNYVAGQYFGSNGISGADWQAAIQIRDIAIHNIPFGGFIGYLWYRNFLATGDDATDLAAQFSYERAYASTLTVQSEIPTWTGNAGTTNTWADGFNWAGGLPSTTQNPYPLLAPTNPDLPKQTTANLFKTIKVNTTITLDADQSVTRLAFDSPFSYTLAPGNAGSLTLAGASPSIAVLSGSHKITAPLSFATPATLSISAGAQLDVTTNSLLLSTPAATIRQYLLGNQLTSSAPDPNNLTSLGYLTTSSTQVKLTYTGDANLDGKINADDYTLLDRGLAVGGSTWSQGDFNYDGIVNNQDYLLIDRVVTLQGTPLSPDLLAGRESRFGPDYVSTLLTSLPEPSPVVACVLAALLPLRRRTRPAP